jgi:hypothetical protein
MVIESWRRPQDFFSFSDSHRGQLASTLRQCRTRTFARHQHLRPIQKVGPFERVHCGLAHGVPINPRKNRHVVYWLMLFGWYGYMIMIDYV